MYRITVKPEIARLRDNDGGTRNVRVGKGTAKDPYQVLTFSRRPTMLDKLPPEVEADRMLVVTKVEGAAPAASEAPTAPPAAKASQRPATTPTGAELVDDDDAISEVEAEDAGADADSAEAASAAVAPTARKRRTRRS